MKTVDSLFVVDDNPGDVELCRLVFGESGRFPYIFTAKHGEEALEHFLDYERKRQEHGGKFPPVLMLLDINMPRLDGFGFLEAYAKVRGRLKDNGTEPSIVVMLTSSSDPRDKERALASGVVADFITKPPTPDDATRLAERFGAE